MTKLLFFDIDGTLAYPMESPPYSAVHAIRAARDNGHKAFISTGRTWDSIPHAIADIGFDGGIYSAGGIVMLDSNILAQHYIADQTVQAILSLLKKKNVFYVLETADGRFHSENGHTVLAETDMANVSAEMQQLTSDILLDSTARPLADYSGQPIFKIAYHSADPKITEQLTRGLDGIAKIVQFDNIPGLPITIGEISDPNVNKGHAMMDVCHHYGVTADDCIAFGDSRNDSEIILAAGLGVAMGNADTELKAIADLVCDQCEQDGIAKALHDFGLI